MAGTTAARWRRIAALGENARGVAVVDTTAADAELARLTRGGMRGVHFRMLDTPELPWEMLGEMAARVVPFGWHVQFQMDGWHLHEREAVLKCLPCDLVIEHVGKFLDPVPPHVKLMLMRVMPIEGCNPA